MDELVVLKTGRAINFFLAEWLTTALAQVVVLTTADRAFPLIDFLILYARLGAFLVVLAPALDTWHN